MRAVHFCTISGDVFGGLSTHCGAQVYGVQRNRTKCSMATLGKEKDGCRLIQSAPFIMSRIAGTAESETEKGSQDE